MMQHNRKLAQLEKRNEDIDTAVLDMKGKEHMDTIHFRSTARTTAEQTMQYQEPKAP